MYLLFAQLVTLGVLLANPGAVVVLAFFTINIASWLLYTHDKEMAKQRRTRVPERKLLWVTLCGGAPGAELARTWSRHKTKKRYFDQAVVVGLVVDAVAVALCAIH